MMSIVVQIGGKSLKVERKTSIFQEGGARMLYLGTYFHTRDAKGRVFVPALFRESLGEEFILFKSPDKCIWVYNYEEYQNIVNQVKQQSRTPEDRVKQRNFFLSSKTVSMDKQGRFTIPQDFASHASLGSEVVITGAANRLEIWNKDAYDAMVAASENLTASDFPDAIY